MMKKILVLTIVLVLSTMGFTNACNPDAGWYKGQQFGDVWPYHWYYNDVNELAKAGLINGVSEYCRASGGKAIHFKADDPITVEEFWAILSRILSTKFGEEADKIKTDNLSVYLNEPMKYHWSYKDYCRLALYFESMSRSYSIKKGLKDLKNYDGWFTNNINNYGNLGIQSVVLFTNGNADLNVSSNEIMMNYKQPITREQAAAAMGLFIADEQMTSVNILGAKDWLETRRTAGVNMHYRKYINELIERGLFKGVEKDGEMYAYPKNNLTRGEAAALLNRFYKNLHLVD